MTRKTAGQFGYLPRHRGLVRLLGVLVAIAGLAAAATLLLMAWPRLDPARQPAKASPGAVLLVYSPEQAAGQYHLLQAALREAGIASATWQSAGERTDSLLLQAAVEKLATSAGCTAGKVWLAAAGNISVPVFQAGSQIDCAGQIMLAPRDLAGLTSGLMRQWPAGRPVAIFTVSTAADPDAQAAREFYERLTGEDIQLFPGYRAAGIFHPQQFLSAKGVALLNVYPVLTESTALLSGQVLGDVTDWLADWNDTGSGINRLAARSAVADLAVSLLLAGLLLLIVPLGLILALDFRRSDGLPAGESGRTALKFDWLASILLWLPALALAAAAGFLAAWLIGRPGIWLLAVLALLPGCRGWLLLTLQLFRRNRRTVALDLDGQSPGVRLPVRTFPLTGKIAGMLALAIVLALTCLWTWLTFGSIAPSAWTWLILPLLGAFNWSAGLSGTAGRIGRAGEPDLTAAGRLDGLWQHLPFLILPFPAVLILGWPGLLAALLLLAVHLWSVSLAKAAVLLTGRARIASLFQTAGYTLGFLLPPIVSGFLLFH